MPGEGGGSTTCDINLSLWPKKLTMCQITRVNTLESHHKQFRLSWAGNYQCTMIWYFKQPSTYFTEYWRVFDIFLILNHFLLCQTLHNQSLTFATYCQACKLSKNMKFVSIWATLFFYRYDTTTGIYAKTRSVVNYKERKLGGCSLVDNKHTAYLNINKY